MNLVRITFEKRGPSTLIVEYGEWIAREITLEEKAEMEKLNTELIEFSDFSTASELADAKRQELMIKKKRLEELEEKRDGAPELIWKQREIDGQTTVLLIYRRDQLPIYVEDLPGELIDKLLDSHIHLNITQGSPMAPQPQVPAPPIADSKLTEVQRAIDTIDKKSNDGAPWLQLVEISMENPAPGQKTLTGTVYIMPVKFLKGDWDLINVKLKEAFGDKLNWTRAGKQSFWSVI